MLTLDQDTVLPENFLQRIAKIAEDVKYDLDVAAILPRVIAGKKRLSPFCFAMGALPQAVPVDFMGVRHGATYAVNSAATLRIASLKLLDGYNSLFPLDISDMDLFHRVFLSGMSVYIAGDLVVLHDFSLLDKGGRMSLERYRNLLRDECAFWDINMSVFGRAERMMRLAGRICKDIFRPGSSEFRRITRKEIYRRLVTRRSTRIKQWSDWANSRRLRATFPVVDLPVAVSQCNERLGGEARQ